MAQELLLACAWKGTVILAAACGVAALARGVSAAARHLVWATSFLALLLLPLFSLAAPAWSILPRRGTPMLAAGTATARPGAKPAAPAPQPRDWLALIWLAGAALGLARFGAGSARVWLLTRKGRPMQLDGWTGRTLLLDAGPKAMPLAWGLRRPLILLPSEAREWPAARLAAVLRHELAHVERGDCWTLGMAEIALALYWFHPLAWWGALQMRRERERACDDCVLLGGVAASEYSNDLLTIARDTSFAAPAMARRAHLETRVRAILDPATPRRALGRGTAGIAAAAALLALIPLAALRLDAQAVTGLSGTVYDVSGAAVPGASVSILSGDSGRPEVALSDASGSFAFPNLPAGRYQLKVRHPGFALYVREGVKVPGTQDVSLSLGQIAESITVSGKGSGAEPRVQSGRIRVGGSVQAAKLLWQVKPLYPPSAEAGGLQGRVLLTAVVTVAGGISGLSVLSSPNQSLTDAAVEAVRQWRYQPTLLNGQPVEVITTIAVNFRLDQ